jgi:hypothetical protein
VGVAYSPTPLGRDATEQTLFKIQIWATYLIFLLISFLHINTREAEDLPGSNAVLFSAVAKKYKKHLPKSVASLPVRPQMP